MFGIGQVEAASFFSDAIKVVGRDAGLSSSFPHEPNNQSEAEKTNFSRVWFHSRPVGRVPIL